MLYAFVLHEDSRVQRQLTCARVTFYYFLRFETQLLFLTCAEIKVNSIPIRSKIPFYTAAYRTTQKIS